MKKIVQLKTTKCWSLKNHEPHFDFNIEAQFIEFQSISRIFHY